MRPCRYIFLMWMTGLILSSSVPLWSQSPFDRSCYPAALRISEEVEIFTDRSIYVVGEPIHFRADHFVKGLGRENQ